MKIHNYKVCLGDGIIGDFAALSYRVFTIFHKGDALLL